jgi:hypothetical protein
MGDVFAYAILLPYWVVWLLSSVISFSATLCLGWFFMHSFPSIPMQGQSLQINQACLWLGSHFSQSVRIIMPGASLCCTAVAGVCTRFNLFLAE